MTIAATVSNTGGSQGTYKAVLKVNDIVQQEQNITLKPGETKLVTFTVSKQSAGAYRVQVGDKTASFSVTAAQSAITFPSWLPALLLAIGAVVLLVLIVIISRRLAG